MADARAIIDQLLYQPDLHRVLDIETLRPADPRRFAQLFVAMEAGEFYSQHLYRAAYFDNWVDHIRAMTRRAVGFGAGLCLEFGVASGTTLRAIAEEAGRQVDGFDSFKGLPEDWRDGIRQGAFAMGLPEVPPNARLHVGMIEETLPAFLAGTAEPIRFIHIDTDLYSAAHTILTLCGPRLADRSIIVFDEFFNYPGWRDHEYKAFCEFRDRTRGVFDITFAGLGGRVAVSVELRRLTAG